MTENTYICHICNKENNIKNHKDISVVILCAICGNVMTKRKILKEKSKMDVEWGKDLRTIEEDEVMKHFDTPVVVTNYPKEIMAFYKPIDPKDPKNIYNDRNFRKTSAGKNKMVVCIDNEVFSRPGPRVVQALEEMAAFAYGWGREIEQTKE